MTDNIFYQELAHGITCIDTMQQRRGLAACYLIEHDGMAGFIETGTNKSVPILQEVLRRKRIAPESVAYIMPTHVHLDHAGGVGGLMQAFPNAQLLVHPRGARHMIAPEKLQAGATAVYGEAAFAEMYGDLIPVAEDRVIEVNDNFELDFNGRRLLFLDTPGHARHHYCIYDELSEGLFTGDTFGVSYPELNNGRARFIFPPTTPIQFDPEAWVATLRRLMSLNPKRVYLTHFGMQEDLEPLFLLLRQTIEEYAELALEYKDLDNRVERLTQALFQDTLNYLLDQQCGLDVETIKQYAMFDMKLNAQGLDHWLNT